MPRLDMEVDLDRLDKLQLLTYDAASCEVPKKLFSDVEYGVAIVAECITISTICERKGQQNKY